jgi:thiamine biosynthesis lipoprotein
MGKRDNGIQRNMPKSMDRRSFLRLSGLLGLGVASATLVPLTAQTVSFNKKTMKVSETRLAMGTFVSMTLVHPSRDQAEEAMGRAFDQIVRLEGVLSRYDQSTPVFFLNKQGTLKDAPPEVSEVLGHSIRFNNLTAGNFDVTVKPAVDLFKDKVGEKKMFPTDQEIRVVLSLIGTQYIDFREKTISFRKSGMGVTFDGIAKGYIVDRAAQVLSNHHIENFLINAGGDIRTRGAKEHNQPWVVAIEDPRKGQKYPDIIQMRDGAIATSGNYEVYFDKEKMFHHIIDPRTGLSPHLSTSVTIMAKTTMEADALATSVFVMNPQEGTGFIDSLPNCESLVISRDGTLLRSKGWKRAAI